MTFDFSLTERVEQWRDRITAFIDDVVVPREQDAFAGGVDDTLRKELQQQAKAAGNCSAPDEGNIHMLHMIATPSQQQRYLLPLVAGDVRSCFAMTEPPPGAGSDPAALRTSATQVSGGWLISGDKHLISGAEGAAFAIVMAAGAGRSGWRRPGSRTACAGSGPPGGRTRSPWRAASPGRCSARRWPSTAWPSR
jgi:acyl-CoA dehydrogenase